MTFKRIHDVILEGLPGILSEHLLEVNHDALVEEIPSLGENLGMHHPVDISTGTASHLGSDDLFPGPLGFFGEEISIELKFFCSFHLLLRH